MYKLNIDSNCTGYNSKLPIMAGKVGTMQLLRMILFNCIFIYIAYSLQEPMEL